MMEAVRENVLIKPPGIEVTPTTFNWCLTTSTVSSSTFLWSIENCSLMRNAMILNNETVSSNIYAPSSHDFIRWKTSVSVQREFNTEEIIYENWLSVRIIPIYGEMFKSIHGKVGVIILDMADRECFHKDQYFSLNEESDQIEMNLMELEKLDEVKSNVWSNDILRLKFNIQHVANITNVTDAFPYRLINVEPCFNFTQYFINDELSDGIIRIQDTEFPIHKVILFARAEQFKTLFVNSATCALIENAEENSVKNMLQFVYTSRLLQNLESVEILRLFELAKRFCLEQMELVCLKLLSENLNERNVLNIFKSASVHGIKWLQLKAAAMIRESWSSFVDEDDWLEICRNGDWLSVIISLDF